MKKIVGSAVVQEMFLADDVRVQGTIRTFRANLAIHAMAAVSTKVKIYIFALPFFFDATILFYLLTYITIFFNTFFDTYNIIYFLFLSISSTFYGSIIFF